MSDHPFASDAPTVSKRALEGERLLTGAYWAELRMFLGLAKAGSINAAARELGVGKFTISRQIQRLQDLLGTPLVTISKVGTALTDEGRSLVDLLQRFDVELQSITDDLRGTPGQLSGSVRVAVTDGLGLTVITPALPAFQARHPDIQIHLKTPTNMRSLRENAVDMMIGFSSEEGTDLTQLRLGTAHMLPFASLDYIDQHGEPALDDIGRHRFVNSERYTSQRGPWSAWNALAEQGQTAYLADAAMTYAMLVKMGLGIGLVPSFNALEPSVKSLSLGVEVALPIWAVAVKARLRARHVREVFAFLCELFGPDNPWFAPEIRLDMDGAAQTAGYRKLFNL